MNFRRELARKLVMVVPVAVVAALMIALVAMPAGALTKMTAQLAGGAVVNSPDLPPPVPVLVPEMINYQGYLTDSDGNPINDTLEMTFSIYETATGGIAVWTETHPSVAVSGGLFNVLLGSVNPINASHLSLESYLGVRVGGDEEMTPRQRIVSAAYAHRCHVADTLDGWNSTDFVAVAGDTMTGTLNLPADGLVAGTDQLVLTGGNVGIGTTSPGYKLDVQGTIQGIHSSGNKGILGSELCGVFGDSSSGHGVAGVSSTGDGVYGEHSGSGNTGLLGGSSYGVQGVHSDSGNYGFIGTSGEGVYGEHGTSGNFGSLGTSSYGVYGYGTTHDFYAGNTGTYGSFTGAHDVKLSTGFPEDIRPGMIVSVTGETQVRTDEGEISYSSTLPTVQLADTPNDKTVFGVLISESPLPEDHWYQAGEGDRFGIVNALGEGRVWVTNINGDIEAGDYITTSAIAGYGQKQDDDLLHSYTLGKAIETVDWSEVTETIEFNGQIYKAYPIAVVYTSG